MAFNGQGLPAEALAEALAAFHAEWNGVVTPSNSELADWLAANRYVPAPTIAVGNRARREFVRLYGTGSVRRPRTQERPGVPDVRTPVAAVQIKETLGHGAGDSQPRADLPEPPRWDAPPTATSYSWRSPQPEVSEHDSEDAMLRRWQEDHARDRSRWHREVAPRVCVQDEALPVGLTLFGDQHVDDDGCDVRELVRTVRTVASTPGLYGVNLGDVTNNWTGKLAHLWAHQSTTHDEAARRAGWLMRSLPWLLVVSGNHDDWADSTLRMAMVERKPLHFAKIEGRLELRIGGQAPIRIVARHQFKGSSMWHPHHGLKREIVMGDRWGDVYVQGHHHDSHASTEELPDGRRVWTVKARGFKHFDSYAHRLQFHDHQHGHAPTLVLDPWSPPADRVRVVFDVEEAAAMVTWLRERRRRVAA